MRVLMKTVKQRIHTLPVEMLTGSDAEVGREEKQRKTNNRPKKLQVNSKQAAILIN